MSNYSYGKLWGQITRLSSDQRGELLMSVIKLCVEHDDATRAGVSNLFKNYNVTQQSSSPVPRAYVLGIRDESESDSGESVKDTKCRECEIIHCNGYKCRINHSDGRGIHCGSCYESDHEDTPVDLNSPDHQYDGTTIINCRGEKCRIHKRDGKGIHCIACYDELDDNSDYE
jgi:hypothetical protein